MSQVEYIFHHQINKIIAAKYTQGQFIKQLSVCVLLIIYLYLEMFGLYSMNMLNIGPQGVICLVFFVVAPCFRNISVRRDPV